MATNNNFFTFSGKTQIITNVEVIPRTTVFTAVAQASSLRVLSNTNEYLTISPGTRPSGWELRKGFTTIHSLESGKHTLDIECLLPTAAQGVDLQLFFSVEWMVLDPLRVIEEDIRDVSPLIIRLLGDVLRQESRNWTDERTKDAEDSFRRIVPQSLKYQAFQFQAYNFTVVPEKDRLNRHKQHQNDLLNMQLTTGHGIEHMIARLIANNPDNVLEIVRTLRGDQINSIKDRNYITELLRERGVSDAEIDEMFHRSNILTPSIEAQPTRPPLPSAHKPKDILDDDEE